MSVETRSAVRISKRLLLAAVIALAVCAAFFFSLLRAQSTGGGERIVRNSNGSEDVLVPNSSVEIDTTKTSNATGADPRAPTPGVLDVRVECPCLKNETFDLTLTGADGSILRDSNDVQRTQWTGIPAGAYTIVCRRPAWSDGKRQVILPDSADHLSIAMLPPFEIQGAVYDAATSLPVTKYMVTIESRFDENGVIGTLTDQARIVESEEGSFCAVDEELRTKDARLKAWADGYDSAVSDWRPMTSRRVDFEPLPLRRSTSEWAVLEGIVVDSSNAPVAGAIVQCAPGELSFKVVTYAPSLVNFDISGIEKDNVERRRGITDAHGHFAVNAIVGEAGSVVVWCEGFAPARSSARVTGAKTNIGRITVDRGANVHGRIYLSDDNDALGFPKSVVLESELYYARRDVSVCEDPRVMTFTIAGAPMGTASIEVQGTRDSSAPLQAVSMALARRIVSLQTADDVEEFDLGGSHVGLSVAGVFRPCPSTRLDKSIVDLFDCRNVDEPATIGWFLSDGGFKLHGVTPGEYVAIAIGASDDGSSVCFAARSLKVESSIQSLDLIPDATRVDGYCEESGTKLERKMLLRVSRQEGGGCLDAVLAKGWPFATDLRGAFVIEGLPFGLYKAYSLDQRYTASFVLSEGQSRVSLRLQRNP